MRIHVAKSQCSVLAHGRVARIRRLESTTLQKLARWHVATGGQRHAMGTWAVARWSGRSPQPVLPLASKRARDKHTAASLKGRRAGGATTVTAGQRTPSGALMAKALTDGADEAKSGGMGMGRASRTPRGSPGVICGPSSGRCREATQPPPQNPFGFHYSVVEFTTRPSIRGVARPAFLRTVECLHGTFNLHTARTHVK